MLKKWSYTVLLSVFFAVLSASTVSANSIKSIDKTIALNKDGSAHVTEVWQAQLSQGTEGYEAFSDLHEKTIENFQVSDDTNTIYEVQTPWDTYASFEDKAYKNGINKTYNGLELCWGISKYGSRTYTLDYDIKNLVTLYADNIEGLHFNFFQMDQTVDKASVTVKMADGTPLSLDNARIWGFGYTGSAVFAEDGSIRFTPSGTMDNGSYTIALIRFQTQLFSDETLVTSTSTFDEIYEEALADSEYEKQRQEYYDTYESLYGSKTKNSSLSNVNLVIGIIFALIITAIPITLILQSISTPRKKFKGVHVDNVSSFRSQDFAASREIPCDKEILPAFWLMQNYPMDSERDRKTGLVGATILQLVLKKQIGFEKRTDVFWKKGKESNYLDLRKATADKNTVEGKFIDILKDAAGMNDLLEPDEFKKWSKRHYERLSSWFDEAYDAGEERANDFGYIEERDIESKGWFGVNRTNKEKFATQKAYIDATKLAGLKNFLSEFSTVTKDIGVQEVSIWEEYLLFAELFGIAEQVRAQLKKLYPKIVEEWSYKEYDIEQILSYVSDFSKVAYSGMAAGIAAAAARRAAISSSSSYSGSSGWSGGGGSSSSGGGGSSGGSSGGGFR